MKPISDKLTDVDFVRLQEFVLKEFGIILQPQKKERLLSAVSHKMKQENISNFQDYFNLLKSEQNEKQFFINCVTNVSTKFFRENYQFDFLAEIIIPRWLKESKDKIRIWSAGCASGEEPYSIAITLYENIKFPHLLDIKILATDINTNALNVAKKGCYKKHILNGLKSHKKWFIQSKSDEIISEDLIIDPKIHELIQFNVLNLLGPWPIQKKFDIIFFRNVSIYMSSEAISRILNKFDDFLQTSGYLILGSTESMDMLHEKYKFLGNNIYQKL